MTELIKLQQSFAIAAAAGSPNFLMSIGEAKIVFDEIDRLRRVIRETEVELSICIPDFDHSVSIPKTVIQELVAKLREASR